jgi:hypothetical protein
VNTVRDDTATTRACPVCASAFDPAGRQRFCSTGCRQAAWRTKQAAPVEPVVTRSDTVYACPTCEARYLGQQRCDTCNTWCRRLGPGALCPCCDEPIAISDLLAPDQLLKSALKSKPGGGETTQLKSGRDTAPKISSTTLDYFSLPRATRKLRSSVLWQLSALGQLTALFGRWIA